MRLTRRKLGRPADNVHKRGLGVHRRLRIKLNTPKGDADAHLNSEGTQPSCSTCLGGNSARPCAIYAYATTGGHIFSQGKG